MPIKLANNASGTLATAINASDTGIALTTGDGAEFPTLGASDYFYATITSTQGTQEIVKATARSGDSLTVVRAQEGTSAAGFAAGSRLELRVTAQSVFDAVGDVVASQVGFTPTGGVAATDVQAAIAELDTEKVAFARLDDSDGASLVGFLQTGIGAAATTVQEALRRIVSVKDFGAVGDGVTDDTAAVSNWLTYLIANDKGGFVPAGTYLLGAKISVSNCDKLAIYGEGSTVSIFKRANGVVTSSFTEMFSLANKVGGGSELVVKGIGFDGNARGNMIAVNVTSVVGTFQVGEQLVGKDCTIGEVSAGQLKFTRYINSLTTSEVITGATSGATATVVTGVDAYVWQQSHCIRTSTSGSLAWNRVVFDDIWATDPTADVLGMGGNASNTYGHISVTNLFVQERNRVRSDITVTGTYQTLRIANCKTFSTEVELNGYDATGDQSTVITNLVTDTLDLAAEGANDTTGWPPLMVSNTVVNSLCFLLGYNGIFSNCQFLLSTALRFVRGKWRFNNCRFLARSDLSTTLGLLYHSTSGTNARALTISDCLFEAQSGATLPYYFYDENAWGSSSTGAFCEPFVFTNCKFSGTVVRTAVVRGGKFEFSRCTHEYAGYAIFHSSVGSVNDSEIKLFDNVVVNTSGYLWRPPEAFTTAGVSIWMRDNVSATLGQVIDFSRYDKIAAPHGSATGSNAVLLFKQIDRQYASDVAPTTGKWIKGSIIWNSAPAPSGKVGWAVTTSGAAGGAAVFKPFGAIDA